MRIDYDHRKRIVGRTLNPYSMQGGVLGIDVYCGEFRHLGAS